MKLNITQHVPHTVVAIDDRDIGDLPVTVQPVGPKELRSMGWEKRQGIIDRLEARTRAALQHTGLGIDDVELLIELVYQAVNDTTPDWPDPIKSSLASIPTSDPDVVSWPAGTPEAFIRRAGVVESWMANHADGFTTDDAVTLAVALGAGPVEAGEDPWPEEDDR